MESEEATKDETPRSFVSGKMAQMTSSLSTKSTSIMSPNGRDERDSDHLVDKEGMKPGRKPSNVGLTVVFKKTPGPNKMLAFNLPEARKREVHEYLEECALRAKVKLMVAHMKDAAQTVEDEEEEEEKATVSTPEYELMLKKFADVEPPPLAQSWIDNILKILTAKVVQRHSSMVKVILEEVKQEHQLHLLQLSIFTKFTPSLEDQKNKILQPLKPDVGGKTLNYPMFLACRRVIENELFITHPLIRKILSSSKLAIPDVLVNFKNYRKRSWLHLDKLISLIQSDMKKGEHQICKNWYPKLINTISLKNSLETVSRDLWPRFVKCASTVVSVQITQLIQRSISHIIETLSNPNTFPQLSIDAYFSGNIIAIIPSEDEIFISFHRIIDQIAYMAKDMPAMEAWFAVPCPNKYITIKRSESFLRHSHLELERNLYDLFSNVRDYLMSIGDEFNWLCSEKQHAENQTFLKERHTYEEMFVKVAYLKSFSTKIKQMVYREYFPVVRLQQNDVKNHLNKVTNGFMIQILQEITGQQINENKKICSEFELVAERTLHMPVKTKELVAMGSYIKYCRTTFMDKVKTRILKSMCLAIQLMDFISLTEEQLLLNASIVKWLNKIKPIFEEYNDLFENTKYELEERLQRATEKLNKELEDVGPSLSSLSNMDDVTKIADYVQFIQKFLRDLEEFDGTVSWINNEEILFKFPISTYPELDELKSIVHPFAKLIFTCNNWFRTYKIWMDGAFDELILESVDEQVTYFFQELTQTQKTYKTKCKQQATDNYPRRFKGVVDDPDVNNWPAPLKLCSQTLNHINEFKRHLRLIGIVCNSALRQRHWKDLSAIAEFDVTPDAGTTLRKFIGYHLEHLLDPFEVVSVSACKELQLYQTLCNMKAEWTHVVFTSKPHMDGKIDILCDVDDILTLVDNHLIKCVSIRGSAFVKPLIDEVKDWCTKLEQVNATIETWLRVEKQWLDFYPIFTCKTVRSHLNAEVLLFQDVDRLYQQLMAEVTQTLPVVKTAGETGLHNSLLNMLTMLENINAGVKVYLNKLQLYFPRLFFLSQYEILEMLAETKTTEVVHVHLEKMFMGIHTLCYDPGGDDIVAMKSVDGETIHFEQPLPTHQFVGYTEKLLSEIDKQMKVSMKLQCKKCLNMYKKESFREWVVGWPCQAVQCALVTIRTGQIHNCLAQANTDQLQFVFSNIKIQREILLKVIKKTLSPGVRVALQALIILTIHCLDILHLILQTNVISDSDFYWLVQLRYYQEEIVYVKMLNARLPYGYEYIGNMSRLVVTPLTERCFRTLIGAYQMNLHGAPEGPPETGKTESVQDLAKAAGVFCFTFCCTVELSHIAFEKFLKGIAGCGAWACLNDLHKIQSNVLSVVAQHLMTITDAVRINASSIIFDGEKATFNPQCYICVTFLPGIAAQSSIPENLKMLFRPVAMMTPDSQIIAEVCLQSYGFTNCRQLALRLVTTQTLCSKQLSYKGRFTTDFGSLKAVLLSASNLKQSYSSMREDDILLKAISEAFHPKLDEDDIQILNSILNDSFPNIEVPCSEKHLKLKNAATKVCEELNFQSKESFLSKIVEIHDALEMYTGIILVGEPFTGKTSALKVIKQIIFNNGGEEIKNVFINPKTMSLPQLYGYIDQDTKEWTDGIIPKLLRECDFNQWLIFDGPLDSSWLDLLNTAFDSTRNLCLTSGEIIPILKNVSVIFETLDLDQVSPATVSRCGVVYHGLPTVGWESLAQSWLSSPAEYHTGLSTNYLTLFHWIIPPTLTFFRTKGRLVMKAGTLNAVRTTLTLIEMMLKDGCADSEDYAKHLPVWIQSSFFLAAIWGFGGALSLESREQFDAFFRDLWRGNIEEHPMPETIEKLEINIPSEGQLNDYWYHFKGKGAWRFWPEVVRSLKIEEDMPNLQFTMVSTIDSAKYLNILEMHVKHHVPVLLTGPTATGKSFYINKIINKLSLEKNLPITIPFSSNTTAQFLQSFVMKKLERKNMDTYRAAGGSKAVLFVDDVNMCSVDSVGTHRPLEVLHHYLDHGLWFQERNNLIVKVTDLLVLGAGKSPGGNRRLVCPRVLRHFSLFALNPLHDETITKIYSTLLFTGFKRNGFATDVMPTVMCIVAATADILQWISQTLRPTPKTPHYAFNLRDYAKLIFSHLLVKRENVDSKKVFIRLWVHEALRVFSDRLVESADRVQVIHRLRFAVKEFFKDSFDASLDNLLMNGQQEIEEDNLRNLIFTTALNAEGSEDKKYEEVGSLDNLLKALTTIIETHNNIEQNSPINIVLFRFALEHLCRLCRVLSLGGGSCLMLGMRGSGRQTIAQLAAILCKAHFSRPSVGHNYGLQEWRADLKRVLIQAGGSNTKSLFFVSENELSDDLFLQDIEMFLSTGHVPDLFSSPELEDIFEMVRLSAQGGNRNLDINPLTVFAFFVSCCRQNLHIVLSLSSISYSFRRWLSLYPSLLNHCTIDWVEPYEPMKINGKEYILKDWPEEALEKIAYYYWQELEMDDIVKESAVSLCKYIHVTARDATEKYLQTTGRTCYVTSASYLTMVKKYHSLISLKREEILVMKAKFISALDKLEYANSQVAVMQKELEALQPQLQVATDETQRMLVVIEGDTLTIEKASGLVREDESVAKVQAAAANNLKNECEADLALAIPILEEAVAALNTLKPTDITLVKSMKNPPDTVKLVMAAVCVMKDIKPEKIPDPNTPGRKILDYWGPSKRLLGDMAFLQQLKDYDKDNIPPPIISMIRKQYLPNKDFKPHIVAKASSAAEGLCKWVIAMDMYDAVAKEVAPKKAKLEIAEREFAATMAILEEKRAQVRLLEEKLMDLNAKLDAAQQRRKVLQDQVHYCEAKLFKAQKLIGGLEGEKKRWIQSVDNLQICLSNLPGDILLACGFIAYLSFLDYQSRDDLTREWCKMCQSLKIPISDSFNFVGVLGVVINIQRWNIKGLPRDEFSVQNAVLLEYTDRCPILIDPQGHANLWTKAMEKGNGLQVLRVTDEDYIRAIETSLDEGNPVLLENVEEDLNGIILCPFFVKRDTTEKSKVFITTRLQNPVFSPTVFNNFCVVNFTVTLQGLEVKLLDIVIAKERPELQEMNQEIILATSRNEQKLQEVQKRILETLTYTKGNLLENESAVNILETAKNSSIDIKEKQAELKTEQVRIKSFCKQYLQMVQHSAALYFCLTKLICINYMYQFSLDWFLKTYSMSIESANKSQVTEKRLCYLEENITYTIYNSVCSSLFMEHRILFSLLLCTTIELKNKTLPEEEFNVLLQHNIYIRAEAKNPAPDWIQDSDWNNICQLDTLTCFSGFSSSFSANISQWKDVNQTSTAELPSPWNSQLSTFQKLLVIKILYPDKVTESIVRFVLEKMGPQYTTYPSFDISSCFENSNCLTPLLFILSPASDPISALRQFANKKQFYNRLHTLSLGVDQGTSANALVQMCREEGNWLCLQNCHLAQDYMLTLEKICDSITLQNTSMEFRLWLTSAPTNQFPVSILQGSMKMTTCLQSGLKQRLMHSFLSEPVCQEEFFYGCPGKDRGFAKLLYSLSFMHAVVEERGKYGCTGWNKPYHFTEVDFHISLHQLQMYINEYADIPYDIIQYMIGECNYGGRLYDAWDRRLLNNLVSNMISVQVADTPNYLLSPISEKFQVPLRFEYHDFIVAIQELPENLIAEVFGLNPNSEIQYEIELTKKLLEAMQLLEPTSAQRKFVREDITLSTVETILSQLPECIVSKEQAQSSMSSERVVLRRECKLYNKLVSRVRTTLEVLRDATRGLCEMSDESRELSHQVQCGQVPACWLTVSYPTCYPLAQYVQDLTKRVNYIQGIVKEDVGSSLREVWLPGLFWPQALLTASLHQHSRSSGTAFHLLTFQHQPLDSQTQALPPDTGIVVTGLYIQGASWDSTRNSLKEQPAREFFSTFPRIWLKPRLRSEAEKETSDRYECPVYVTPSRADFVTQVFLPTCDTPTHWVYRAVVLLCQANI